MTKLSEAGEQEAIRLIASFKDRLKIAADEAIRDLYCDILPFIEGDAWMNFRNHALQHLQDYPSLCDFDAEKVRKAILAKHREAIIVDLNEDLLKKIAELKARIHNLQEQLGRSI